MNLFKILEINFSLALGVFWLLIVSLIAGVFLAMGEYRAGALIAFSVFFLLPIASLTYINYLLWFKNKDAAKEAYRRFKDARGVTRFSGLSIIAAFGESFFVWYMKISFLVS